MPIKINTNKGKQSVNQPQMPPVFKPGQVLQAAKLTPSEQAALKGIGWKPGQPIPANLPKALQNVKVVNNIQEAQKEIEEETKNALPLPPNTPKLTMPKPVGIEELNPEQRKRIAEEMSRLATDTKEAVRLSRLPDAMYQPIVPNDPSIGDAIKHILAASGSETEVTDSTKTISDDQAVEFVAEQWKQHKEAKEEPKVEDKPATTGAVSPSIKCKHCGFDQSKPEPAENPSYEDKLGFLQCVLGQIRFKKRYPLFNGKVVVTFRTLTTEEADLANTQLALDTQSGLVLDEAAFFRTLADYRLVLALDELYVEGQGKIFEAPEDIWEGWETEAPPKGGTKLVHITRYIYQNVLKNEPIRRMVGVNFFNFQRMVELMEARVLDQNFWLATEEQH